MIATEIIEQYGEKVNIAVLYLPHFDESVVKFANDLEKARSVSEEFSTTSEGAAYSRIFPV